MDLIATIVGSFISSTLFVGVTISFGRLFGLATASAGVGVGPMILSWVSRGTRYALKLFPISASVKFRDPVFGDEYEGINPAFRLPALRSLLVIVGPPIVLLVLGVTAYLNGSTRSIKIASLVLVWNSVSCLLPIPGQHGFAAIQRLTIPKNRLPAVSDLPTWFALPAVLIMIVVGLAALVTLCFFGDLAIGIADGIADLVLRRAPSN